MPKGCWKAICPTCKRLFYKDLEHPECNECKNGFITKCGVCTITNVERFNRFSNSKYTLNSKTNRVEWLDQENKCFNCGVPIQQEGQQCKFCEAGLDGLKIPQLEN